MPKLNFSAALGETQRLCGEGLFTAEALRYIEGPQRILLNLGTTANVKISLQTGNKSRVSQVLRVDRVKEKLIRDQLAREFLRSSPAVLEA